MRIKKYVIYHLLCNLYRKFILFYIISLTLPFFPAIVCFPYIRILDMIKNPP
jgi:hypothetical protein